MTEEYEFGEQQPSVGDLMLGEVVEDNRLYVTVMELADGSMENYVGELKVGSEEEVKEQIRQLVQPLAEWHKSMIYFYLFYQSV